MKIALSRIPVTCKSESKHASGDLIGAFVESFRCDMRSHNQKSFIRRPKELWPLYTV